MTCIIMCTLNFLVKAFASDTKSHAHGYVIIDANNYLNKEVLLIDSHNIRSRCIIVIFSDTAEDVKASSHVNKSKRYGHV